MTILAETSSSGIFEDMLLVVHVVVCLLLCLVVLMQRPKQEGLGAAFGGGMTDQAFGARTTDVLQKGTVYLASALFIITLVLSILVGSRSTASLIEQENQENVEAAMEEAAPKAAKLADELESEELADKVKEMVETEQASEGEKPEADKPENDEPKAAEETVKPQAEISEKTEAPTTTEPAQPEASVEPVKPAEESKEEPK